MSARVIAVPLQKGGSAKTFTTFSLAGVAAERGARVLCVDLDQQGNLSTLLIDEIFGRTTIKEVLLNERVSIREALVPTRIEGIDLIPCNLDFADADARAAGDFDVQYRLRDKLSEVRDNYDLVLIDCPPSLGVATRAALVTADGLLIPVECSEAALRGAIFLGNAIADVSKRANPRLRVIGYVISRLNPRRAVDNEFRAAVRARYGELVLATEIPDLAAFKESIAVRLPIGQYRPGSREAKIMEALADEVFSGAFALDRQHLAAVGGAA